MKKSTLTLKLFLGYLLMVALTITVGIYAVTSLDELRQINLSVVEVDLPLIEAVHEMIDILSVQDLYARKYAILKDKTTEELFWSRSGEFEQWLGGPAIQRGSNPRLQKRLVRLHDEYNQHFKRVVVWVSSGREPQEIDALLRGPFQTQMDEQGRLLRQLEQKAREDQQEKLLLTNRRSQESWMMTMIISMASLALGLGFASFATYRIGKSIQQLKEATIRIAEGEFERLPPLETDDVVGDLGDSFQRMSRQLKEIGEMKLDANPLTQLPGNIAVERELTARLHDGKPFAFCYLDLKDFKAFGDRYGYSRGSDVLTWVSQILIETIRADGEPHDFVGHIGGDDFVMITEPPRVQLLSERVIKEFDRTIPSFYNEDDRGRGYIISRDRKDNTDLFPIMTISIAVVTNEQTPIHKPGEVAERAAQLKKYAKSLQRSAYVFQKDS